MKKTVTLSPAPQFPHLPFAVLRNRIKPQFSEVVDPELHGTFSLGEDFPSNVPSGCADQTVHLHHIRQKMSSVPAVRGEERRGG